MMKLRTLIPQSKYSPLPQFILLALALVLLTVLLMPDGGDPDLDSEIVQAVVRVPALFSNPEEFGLTELSGSIAPGMPFRSALLESGLSPEVSDSIQRHLETVDFDFRRCIPGQQFTAQVDSCGQLQVFAYRYDRLSSYWVCRDTCGFLTARRWETPVAVDTVSIEGRVLTSVYQTIMSMGEKPQLVADFVDVLGYDIDFIFDPRRGDTFRILVEKQTLDGELIGYGRILSTEYRGELTGTVRGYWFDTNEKLSGYFAPDGENLQKAFMRSPLSILRVTSGFGIRTHPISGMRKMHTGIDYGAPTGTPVWAVGAGTVIHSGSKGGYGNTIEIKHAGSVVTRYGHLSKVLVRRGQSVHQHQTIGLVGSTGYSTGPHLHFEYLVNGHFTPPRKVKNPSLKRLPSAVMPAFTRAMQSTDSLWLSAPRLFRDPEWPVLEAHASSPQAVEKG